MDKFLEKKIFFPSYLFCLYKFLRKALSIEIQPEEFLQLCL